MNGARAARAAAIAIAVAAAIDPGFTRTREVPVRVRVVHPTAPEAVETMQRALGDRFQVRAAEDGAAAAWIVMINEGDPLPRVPDNVRVFTLEMERSRDLYIQSLAVPADVIRGQAVTVSARVRARGLKGDTLETSLFAGTRLAARVERAIDTDDARLDLVLRFVPESAGLLPLRLEFESRLPARVVETATRVAGRRLRVRFEDSRPSWTSTFVRRALEAHPMFDVTSSVATARGLMSESGGGPVPDEALDAMVLGSPSAAPPALVSRFERFVRERGGAGIVLADEESGGVLTRLTGTGPWRRHTLREPVPLSGGATMRIADALIAPRTPYSRAATALPGGEIVVHDVAAGHGRVVVAGALDAWRYRSDEAFSSFWQNTIAEAAASAAMPFALSLPAAARAGDAVDVEAVVLGAARDIEGVVVTPSGERPIRFVRGADTRTWHARLDAGTEGTVVARASAGSGGPRHEAAAELFVSPRVFSPPASPAHVAALAPSHGGAHIDDGDLEELRRALETAFPAHGVAVDVRPMRYAWWLAPFTLLLGYEWRWRRRHGMR